MTEKFQYILYAVIALAIFALGVWFRGCITEPCPEITTEEIFVIPDSQKALIYAEGFEEGKNSVKQIVIRKTSKVTLKDTLFVPEPDMESQMVANYLFGVIDSLINENGKIKDLVMYDVIDSTRFRLELYARWKDRSFRGTNLRIFDPPVAERTFWDRWGYGPQLGVGIGAQVEQQTQGGTQLKLRPTLYLGFGIHYDLK